MLVITADQFLSTIPEYRRCHDYRVALFHLLNETVKFERKYGVAEKKFDTLIYQITVGMNNFINFV